MPDLSLYELLCDTLDVQISELLYGKKMTDDQRAQQGEKSAINIIETKSQLETFQILTEVLIFIGIIITITLTNILADTTVQRIITMICGCFVWGFGLMLRIKVKKAITVVESI